MLRMNCKPLDVLIVLCIPYDKTNDKIVKAFDAVWQVGYSLNRLGSRAGLPVMQYVDNCAGISKKDIDYDNINYYLVSILLACCSSLDTVETAIYSKQMKNIMRKLGDENYEDYLLSLGDGRILPQKGETKDSLRDRIAAKPIRLSGSVQREAESSNRRTRSDKGKKRGPYKKRMTA